MVDDMGPELTAAPESNTLVGPDSCLFKLVTATFGREYMPESSRFSSRLSSLALVELKQAAIGLVVVDVVVVVATVGSAGLSASVDELTFNWSAANRSWVVPL